MRQITSYSPFLDGNELLDGTLYVLEHGTTTQASVYDNAGVALSQPITITNGKPSTQVFVANESVDCKVYAGTTLKHTWEDIFVKEEIAFDDIGCVDKIADLRTATASVGDSVVLLGYYAKGDKPSLVYTLVFNALLEDDGGLTIAGAVSGTYWVAKIEGVVDVRHYGIFPNNTASLPNIQRIKWYFPKVSALAYSYDIGSATLHNAQFDNGVRITADGEEQAYVYDSDVDNVTFAGYIKIVGNTLRTSILADSEAQLEARETIIIDSNNYNLTAHNVDIRVYQNFNKNITLTNCQIWNCGGKISSATQHIHNCLIKNDVLVMPANPDYSGNKSDVRVGHGNDFVKFNLLNGIYDFDLQGETISQIDDVGEALTIRNATLENLVSIQTNGSMNFIKCKGTISELYGNASANTGSLEFDSCEISHSDVDGILLANHIKASNTIFDCAMRFYGHSYFNLCKFTNAYVSVMVDDDDEQGDLEFRSCIFENGIPTFSDWKNIYPNTQLNPVTASTGCIYVNNFIMIGNTLPARQSAYYNAPVNVLDTTKYASEQGVYDVRSNGQGTLETEIPYSGSMARRFSVQDVGYDSSYIWCNEKVLSIKALTFNFGESVNKNVYFKSLNQSNISNQGTLWLKATISWYNGSRRKSTSVVAQSINTYVSEYSRLDYAWTKKFNSGSGLPHSDVVDTQSEQFGIVATWNIFDKNDLENLVP